MRVLLEELRVRVEGGCVEGVEGVRVVLGECLGEGEVA